MSLSLAKRSKDFPLPITRSVGRYGTKASALRQLRTLDAHDFLARRAASATDVSRPLKGVAERLPTPRPIARAVVLAPLFSNARA